MSICTHSYEYRGTRRKYSFFAANDKDVTLSGLLMDYPWDYPSGRNTAQEDQDSSPPTGAELYDDAEEGRDGDIGILSLPGISAVSLRESGRAESGEEGGGRQGQ